MIYDCVVVGGGPAGVNAAISAARLGVSVALIERYGFLGGMNTAGLVGPIMTFHAYDKQIVHGIPEENIQKLKSMGGTPGHLVDPIWGSTSMTPIDTDLFKTVLNDQVRASGIDLYLHSMVTGVTRRENRVESVQVASKQGLTEVRGKYFIDCSGDGDLAARAGCEFTFGRTKDGLTQPMSLLFKMGGIDVAGVKKAIANDPENFYLGFPLEKYLSMQGLGVSGYFKEVALGKKESRFPFERDRVLFFGLPREGEITVNTLRITGVDGTNPRDITRAEVSLRSQLPILASFMKDYLPGFENSYIMEIAPQVGIRETRHIHGEYWMTKDDVVGRRRFEDVIAHANYPIDIHSPDGSGMQIDHSVGENKQRLFYDIPLRSLMPKGIANMLVAGRCISAEHEASASARISATCMALGEASGVVTALAVKENVANYREVSIQKAQAQIQKQGAFLETRE